MGVGKRVYDITVGWNDAVYIDGGYRKPRVPHGDAQQWQNAMQCLPLIFPEKEPFQ